MYIYINNITLLFFVDFYIWEKSRAKHTFNTLALHQVALFSTLTHSLVCPHFVPIFYYMLLNRELLLIAQLLTIDIITADIIVSLLQISTTISSHKLHFHMLLCSPEFKCIMYYNTMYYVLL